MKNFTIPDPDATTLVKFHFIGMMVWVVLFFPTVLIWKESILWVAFMSLYANFIGHFSAWDAARAEQSQNKANKKGPLPPGQG